MTSSKRKSLNGLFTILPTSFSVFWLRAMIVFSLFTFPSMIELNLVCLHRRSFSAFLITHTYLMATKKKRQQFFSPSCFFLPLFFFSPKCKHSCFSGKDKTECCFFNCVCQTFFFFFFAHQWKSLRKSLLLHVNLQKYVVDIRHSLRQNIYKVNERGWGQREKRCWGLSGLDPVLSGLQWAVSSLCDSSTGLCLARKRLAGCQAVAEP